MNPDYDWNSIFRQLYTQLLWQSEKLGKMERQLDQITSELQALQRQKPVNVEKIEYNFDQLKVEKLDGTLNIGITPDNVKSIEQFAVGNQEGAMGPGPFYAPQQGSADASPGYQESFSTIKGGITGYLNKDVLQEMQVMEGKFGTPLANEYRAHIVADLSKQVDDRITSYITKYALHDDDEDRSDQITAIVEQVKSDIRLGIESYLQSFPKKEMES
ncbi:MAG: spore germination GerPC family protein [Paenibacillus sp.]|nr:spore germination GerPC family protein [Paenibacillus sp.]